MNHIKGIQFDLNKEALKRLKRFPSGWTWLDMAWPTQLNCGNLKGIIKSDDIVRKIVNG